MASENLVLIGQDTIWALNTAGNRDHLIDSARAFLTFEGDEWERLAEDGRTGDRRDADTFQIVECSDALAALVELHGGQVGFRLVDVDGPAVTVDEYTAPAPGFYGTDSETYFVNTAGIWCVQSPDLEATGGRPTKVSTLPDTATRLRDESCADLDVSGCED